jgi:hypothetical protein
MKERILTCLLAIFMAAFGTQILPAQIPGNPQGYLKGYAKTLRGGDFSFW